MAIDLQTETLEPLNEIQFPLPTQPSPQTRWRWSLKGVRIAGTDQRIRLETVKFGATVMTSKQAVLRLISAANPSAVAPTFTDAQRHGQHEAATRQLQAAGVL